MSTAQRRKSFFGNKDMGTQSGSYKARPIYGMVPRLSIFKHVDGYVHAIIPASLSLFTCSRIGFTARSQMQPSRTPITLSNRRVAKPEEPSLSVLDEAIARYKFKFATQNGRLWCVNAPDYSEERTPDGRSKTIRAMAFTRAVRVPPIVFSHDAYHSTSITNVFGRK